MTERRTTCFGLRHASVQVTSAFAVLAMLGTPAPTVGQEPVAPDSLAQDSVRQVPLYTLQGVTVNVAGPITEAGGTSAVQVSIDSIHVASVPTLEQAMRAMPLLQIRENSRGEAQPALRGSSERQIAVLVDGVPITYGWDDRSDMSIIPLTAVEDIRLIRGLSSVLYGPNVLGGVVELDVARAAEGLSRPEPVTLTGMLDHTLGTQVGGTGGVLLDAGSGQWVLRGGAGYRQRDGHPLSDRLTLAPDEQEELLTEDGDLRLNSDMQHLDGFASARYRADNGAWLSFGGSGYTTERGVPPEINEADPRLWRYPNQWRVFGAASGGTGQRETGWGVGDIEASLGIDLQHTVIDAYGSPEYDEITGGETGDTRTMTARLLGEHTVGDRGRIKASATYADVSHDEELRPGPELATYRQRLWSLGTEFETALDGRGRSRLSVGGVVDGADTPKSGDKPPLGVLWDWGARVGASTILGEGGVALHGSLSRRTRFPSLRELYSGALGRFIPNPDLKPESLVGAEVGATFGGGFGEFQAVVFHHRIEDGIVRVTVETEEGNKRQRVNQDRVRATGLEMLLFGSAGDFNYSADLTLQQVRLLEEDGTKANAEYQPDVMGKLNVGGPLPWALGWNVGTRVVGEQFCTTTASTEGDRLDAFVALDLGLRRSFPVRSAGAASTLDLIAGIDNVTDAAYYDQCGLPQPGRRLRIQFRLQ